MTGTRWSAARLDEVERDGARDEWIPIRRHFGIEAFGVNAWSGDAGAEVVPVHAESGTGHEELYVVLSGRATFSLGGEEVDGPAGTIVFVRDPDAQRGATAAEDGTTILAAGAKPGAPFTVSPWEENAAIFRLFDDGEYERAKERLEELLAAQPGNAAFLYNLACAEARLGEGEAALAHLREAVGADPRFAGYAAGDDDLASIRGEPGFPRPDEAAARNGEAQGPALAAAPAGDAFTVTSLDELERVPVGDGGLTWLPLRRPLGIRSFGTNAYTAAPGGEVVERHTEGTLRHHELYVVVRGHATFHLDGEDVDAPAGTLVFLRDPEVERAATARDEGTVVLALGGVPGSAFTPSAWETFFLAYGRHGDEPERAVALLEEGLADLPGHPALLYHLACFETRAGRTDEALGHLAAAVEAGGERFRDMAARDDDLAPLRGDPRFPA